MILYSKVIPSSLQAAEQGIAELLACLDCGISTDKIFDIRLILNELVVNSIEHGNKYNLDKKIQINMCINKEQVEITIRDQGPGITQLRRCDSGELLECGRGLHIVEKLSDKMIINDNEIHCVITT